MDGARALFDPPLEAETGLGTFGGTVVFRHVCGLAVAALCLNLGNCSNEPSETADGVRRSKSAALERVPLPPKSPSSRGAQEAFALPPVRIVSGEEDNAYSRTIADMAAVLEGEGLQFQAVASQGPSEDLLNLLNRPEADVAIVQTDAVRALPDGAQAAAREQLRYLFRVPGKDLHILAPRGIADVRELNGLKVNIDKPESGTHLTARLIFEKVGIRPEFMTDDQKTAHQRLRSGEIQAMALLAARPSSDVLAFPSEGQFHLLPVPVAQVGRDYTPSWFTSDDYPHLVEAGRRIETASVSRVLAVRNWSEGSPRYRRVARLAEALDAHFDDLKQSGNSLRWRDVGRADGAPGWQRFKLVRDLFDRSSRQPDEEMVFERVAAAAGICSLPSSTTAHERLYREFMEWRRARDKGADRSNDSMGRQ